MYSLQPDNSRGCKIVPFDMLHLVSGTNYLLLSVNIIPVSLSLTHLFLHLSLSLIIFLY